MKKLEPNMLSMMASMVVMLLAIVWGVTGFNNNSGQGIVAGEIGEGFFIDNIDYFQYLKLEQQPSGPISNAPWFSPSLGSSGGTGPGPLPEFCNTGSSTGDCTVVGDKILNCTLVSGSPSYFYCNVTISGNLFLTNGTLSCIQPSCYINVTVGGILQLNSSNIVATMVDIKASSLIVGELSSINVSGVLLCILF